MEPSITITKNKNDDTVSKALLEARGIANSLSLRLANWWNALVPVGADNSQNLATSPQTNLKDNPNDITRSSWYSQKELNKLSNSPTGSDAEENREIIIWLLGRPYKITQLDFTQGKFSSLDQLLIDFQSQPWFTYRHHFPQLKPSSFTTDAGWGCMLRTGQSLLGQALFRRYLGRDWKLEDVQKLEVAEKYLKIMEWFIDDMSSLYPFSIHRIALLGKQLENEIGEWFGPYTMAQVLDSLVKNFEDVDLNVVVTTDGVVYKSSVLKDSPAFKPAFILIPIRLGVDSLNPVYYSALKKCFEFPQMVGIAGGKPSSSLFFMGVEDDDIIYLDPHHSRPALKNKSTWTVEDFSSYHCSQPRKLKISALDPCMLIGFYCATKPEFLDFCDRTEALAKETKPVFRVLDTPPIYQEDLDFESESDEGII